MTETETLDDKVLRLAKAMVIAGETIMQIKQMSDLLDKKIEANQKAIQDLFKLLQLVNKKGREDFDDQFKEFFE